MTQPRGVLHQIISKSIILNYLTIKVLIDVSDENNN